MIRGYIIRVVSSRVAVGHSTQVQIIMVGTLPKSPTNIKIILVGLLMSNFMLLMGFNQATVIILDRVVVNHRDIHITGFLVKEAILGQLDPLDIVLHQGCVMIVGILIILLESVHKITQMYLLCSVHLIRVVFPHLEAICRVFRVVSNVTKEVLKHIRHNIFQAPRQVVAKVIYML